MVPAFPGMNPYFEHVDIWPDFHGSFLIELRTRLNLILPKGYVARWDRSKRVRIVDAHGKRVVTVIEMLSPANKSSGADHDAYLAKRQEYLNSGTNLVEIDLLRGGQRAPVEGDPVICDYCVLVSRAVEFPRAGYWPLSIREPLPTIPIPLDPGIEDVCISLQECLEVVARNGRYDEDLDYTRPPPLPRMSESDATWVRQRLEQTKQQTEGNGNLLGCDGES